jgi:NADH-quinone oxidoreductase subunit M
MLALGGSMVGVFTSVNLLVFYVFWEVMLIPAYFMIGSWGGSNRRVGAAIRFILYTLAGSLLMLIAMLALIFTTTPAGGTPSLDFVSIRQAVANLPYDTQMWMFLAFAAAFVVKVPLVPFHSWQPDAYVEAPVPTTVMLAGVMSKTGAYGFLRFCVLLFPAPARDFAPLFNALAIASILYGALAALGSNNLKRLLAYSSLSHLGFVVLGIFAINSQGVNGAVLQMVNHGITTPALFLVAAAIVSRTGTEDLQKMGGLQSRWPRMGALFLILSLASLGLPGLNQFAGEFLILGGAFDAWAGYAVLGVIGVVLAAWYMMRAFQSIWHGAEKPEVAEAGLVTLPPTDMRPMEYVLFVPLVLLIILLGVAPIIVTGVLDPAVNDWLKQAATLGLGR